MKNTLIKKCDAAWRSAGFEGVERVAAEAILLGNGSVRRITSDSGQLIGIIAFSAKVTGPCITYVPNDRARWRNVFHLQLALLNLA